MNESRRGGARPGAGRPPNPLARVGPTVVVDAIDDAICLLDMTRARLVLLKADPRRQPTYGELRDGLAGHARRVA